MSQRTKDVLKYCVKKIEGKSEKNIVILHDESMLDTHDIEQSLKRVIQNKTIVTYPSYYHTRQQNLENVKNFSQQTNHILITKNRYFNGCEASNVVFLNDGPLGTRNPLMRAVENLICVQLVDYWSDGLDPVIKGMKEDNRFY